MRATKPSIEENLPCPTPSRPVSPSTSPRPSWTSPAPADSTTRPSRPGSTRLPRPASATLAGLPIDGFSDGDGGSLLALVRVNGDNIVLTISDPYGESHTIRARQPYDREVDWFSDSNL